MRLYNTWDHGGAPEDTDHCVVEVAHFGGFHWYQCSRRRVEGELCRQHARMQRAGKHLSIPEHMDGHHD